MVTKSARIQSRRTSTASKVFTSGELLEGELGINMAGKGKLYTKDAAGNVKRLAGNGRAIGDSLQYENYGGFPSLILDDRIVITRANPTKDDVCDVFIQRNPPEYTGPFTGTAVGLLVNTNINYVNQQAEWNALFQTVINAGGGGQHCAAYSQAVRNADGTVWAHCFEGRDRVVNPTTGILGMEVGMFVVGTDDNNNRIAIDVALGSDNSMDGTNIVTAGLRIGGGSRCQAKQAIDLRGALGIGINISNQNIGYSDVSIAMPTNGKMRWKNADDIGGATRAELAWNSAANTFQFSGIPQSTSANTGAAAALPAAPNRYLTIQFNGDLLKIPAYTV